MISISICASKREKPHWGARKIREVLVRRLAGDVRIPATSTIHAVLDRHGLVRRMGKRRHKASGTSLSTGAAPNDLWSTDFKGEFKLGNGHYCLPVDRRRSRLALFILLCEALESTREEPVIAAFERLSSNAACRKPSAATTVCPFASPNGLFHLSKLSVWWLRLGIAIERIRPGRPQQNGRLERMHLTLKQETARPPGLNIIQRQERFDAFRQNSIAERPPGAGDEASGRGVVHPCRPKSLPRR